MDKIGEKHVYMVARHFATNDLHLFPHRDLLYWVVHTKGDVSGQNRLMIFENPYEVDF